MRVYFLVLSVALVATGCEKEPQEILIASNPGKAMVKLNQAELGVTPLKIKITKETSIDIVKTGYKPYTAALSPSDDPNLIVTLEQDQTVAKSKSSISKSNITKLKQMYRQGKINKLDYSAEVRRLEHKMEGDLIDLKMSYKRGDVNKYDYERQARQIKFLYKG